MGRKAKWRSPWAVAGRMPAVTDPARSVAERRTAREDGESDFQWPDSHSDYTSRSQN